MGKLLSKKSRSVPVFYCGFTVFKKTEENRDRPRLFFNNHIFISENRIVRYILYIWGGKNG